MTSPPPPYPGYPTKNDPPPGQYPPPQGTYPPQEGAYPPPPGYPPTGPAGMEHICLLQRLDDFNGLWYKFFMYFIF